MQDKYFIGAIHRYKHIIRKEISQKLQSHKEVQSKNLEKDQP
jgi:hypothetical protein